MKNKLFGKALDLLEANPLPADEALHVILYHACASWCNERSVTLGKKLFEEMKTKKLTVDEPIALALVGACSQIGMRSISEKIVRQMSHLHHDLQLNNSLIDMWVRGESSFCSLLISPIQPFISSSQGKSGDIDRAQEIYQSISQPDLFTYSTMRKCPITRVHGESLLVPVNAYGRNGMAYEAIEIYKRMPENTKNAISQICVLNACSHSGLIESARTIYKSIETQTPQVVTTMVRSRLTPERQGKCSK